ncbi:MAG: lipase family protein [Planctomycetales bacterium]|nr:lipase family protein [Planctomycetales bacterium]
MNAPTAKPTVAQQALAYQYTSRINQPIREYSLLEQSLLFGELSAIAYLPENAAKDAAKEIGFSECEFFDRDGSQAYIVGNELDCVVACRGTEPNEWNDIKADANAISALAETIGRVHRGFKQEVDDLWPRLEQALLSNSRPVWFAGHSLGGAMATICAGRCMLSHIKSNPEGLFTFGSPRVGDKRYINYCKIKHYRWVHNNDIVTRVPPPWMGYKHGGTEMYLNANGKLRRMTRWQRSKDRWRGFIRGLRQGRIDHFSDHSLVQYIDCIRNELDSGSKK